MNCNLNYELKRTHSPLKTDHMITKQRAQDGSDFAPTRDHYELGLCEC